MHCVPQRKEHWTLGASLAASGQHRRAPIAWLTSTSMARPGHCGRRPVRPQASAAAGQCSHPAQMREDIAVHDSVFGSRKLEIENGPCSCKVSALPAAAPRCSAV
jgi:hypothetical protein